MARAKTAPPADLRPLWQRLLFSKWGLYLGVLPVGAAIIVAAVILFRAEETPRREGATDPTRDRLELALREAVLAEPFAGIPESAEETSGGFAFFNGLRISDNPLFAPWTVYAKTRDLIATRAWVEADSAFTGLGFFPSHDLPGALASFASLRDATGEDLLFLLGLAPGKGVDRPDVVAGFERLPDPGLGEESLAYAITVQTPPFAGALGRTVETTVIWSRVGATILFSARSRDVQTPGPPAVASDPIDIAALAASLAARIAAFDPATVPPGPYQFPQPPAAAPDGSGEAESPAPASGAE